jgi:hypothetical protein
VRRVYIGRFGAGVVAVPLLTPPLLTCSLGLAVGPRLLCGGVVFVVVVDAPTDTGNLLPQTTLHELFGARSCRADVGYESQFRRLHDAVGEVLCTPADRGDVEPERGVGKQADLAVRGEPIIEANPGHQIRAPLLSLQLVQRMRACARAIVGAPTDGGVSGREGAGLLRATAAAAEE